MRGCPSKAEESRATAFHSSTRQKSPGCRADKVKRRGHLRRMAGSFTQFNDFINAMSQMLMLQVQVIHYPSQEAVSTILVRPWGWISEKIHQQRKIDDNEEKLSIIFWLKEQSIKPKCVCVCVNVLAFCLLNESQTSKRRWGARRGHRWKPWICIFEHCTFM